MTAGTVTVDSASVRRAWRDSEGMRFWVELRTDDLPGTEPAFSRALDEMNEAEGAEGIFCELDSRSRSGYVTRIDYVDDVQEVERWLNELAERFRRAGIHGTLAGTRSAQKPTWLLFARPPEPTAFALWSIDQDVMAGDPRRSRTWGVSKADTGRLCDTTTRWAEAGGDSILLARSTFWAEMLDPLAVPDRLAEAALNCNSAAAHF